MVQDLESELLMPNFYIINDYYHEHEHPDLGEPPAETAVNSQLSFVKNKSETTQYHFPAGEYWVDLKRDEYFGDYFTSTRQNAALQSVVLNSMQNVILDQHYFEFVKNDLLPESSEEPFKTKEVDGKLSSFFNVQIKFDRNTNGILQRKHRNRGHR